MLDQNETWKNADLFARVRLGEDSMDLACKNFNKTEDQLFVPLISQQIPVQCISLMDFLPAREQRKPSSDQTHATRALHVTRFALHQKEVELFLFTGWLYYPKSPNTFSFSHVWYVPCFSFADIETKSEKKYLSKPKVVAIFRLSDNNCLFWHILETEGFVWHSLVKVVSCL